MDKNIKLKPGDMVIWIVGKDGNCKHTNFITNKNRTIKQFEGEDKVLKVLRPTGYKTVYEAKKEILDEEERKYLSAVIKPFKNNVLYISKNCNFNEENYLAIRIKNDYTIYLPGFKKGTMYNGMELHKKYTLKELGLE